MKQLTRFFGCALLVSTLFVSGGCKKLLDYIGEHPGQGGSNYCALQEFAYKGPYFDAWDTLKFSYNAVGNPVTIMRKQTGTSRLNYFFRYDNKNRLTNLIGSYGTIPGTSPEVWNKYFYDGSGRIVLDSVYFFGEVVNGQPTTGEYGNAWAVKYEYDAKDRITKYSYVLGANPYYVETYAYDASGNRTGDSYDSKVNFHQTNKIWMFLDRNYSVNNPVTKASYTYNSTGLPVTINVTSDNLSFLNPPEEDEVYIAATIKYDCHY
ncbi:MAG TPA: hypothetical protein VGN00_08135 [Puia sp.]|jgi:hypothetical protein